VCLAAVLTACAVLNAASALTGFSQRSGDFGATGVISASAPRRVVSTLERRSYAAPFGLSRSKVCATSEEGY
jgi:hypothetical protein